MIAPSSTRSEIEWKFFVELRSLDDHPLSDEFGLNLFIEFMTDWADENGVGLAGGVHQSERWNEELPVTVLDFSLTAIQDEQTIPENKAEEMLDFIVDYCRDRCEVRSRFGTFEEVYASFRR